MGPFKRVVLVGAPFLVLNLVGCGDNGSAKKDAGSNDARTDAVSDARTDVVNDATPDRPRDAAQDSSPSDGGQDQVVTPPTALTATVIDRRKTLFQLTWPAPSIAGAPVTGYQVRYALVPITAANFDDSTVTAAIPYTGTPAQPGATDGMTVTLNIETAYYFAVEGTDASGGTDGGGAKSAIDATTTPVAAHFLTTTLSGSATTDHVGYDLAGSGDFGTAGTRSFTRDGLSDLIVGSAASTKVLIFFGTSAGYAATPSVTITGTASGFGQGAIDAGDLDGDGLDDIAISSPNDGAGGKIFVFSRKNPPSSWGTTNSWPATLTDTQANYTITMDASFAGAYPIRPLFRAGNFDGTGSDDLGFATRGRGTAGSVLIVKGSTAFSSMSLPDTTRTIEIDGPEAAGGQFGFTAIGIGNFYSGAGPTFITSAVAASAVYAYRGQSTTPTAPDDSTIGTVSQRYGATLGFLGPIATSPGAVSVQASSGSFVDLFIGSASDGPFLGPAGGTPAPTVHFTDSKVSNAFGVVNLGCGIPGTSQTVSMIGGDSIPDLILAGQGEANLPVYIVNGSKMASLSSTVDVGTNATSQAPSNPIVQVSGLVPSSWAGYSTSTIIVDSNGDSYPDFAVGEFTTAAAGRVIVFY
jgi:hypothetical protein